MDNIGFSAKITTKYFKRRFEYDNITVLTATAQYPEVSLASSAVQDRINRRIRAQISRFERFVSTTLYTRAIREYKYAVENNIPIRAFDAVLNYETTYNANCHLSVYRDLYQYTGGAHGTTRRSSDTWSLLTGKTLSLAAFIDGAGNKRHLLINEIIKQANENYLENPGIYFENYTQLILRNFNEKSYYLTNEGIAIYYGQYEIAPYSTGIAVFTVPYDSLVRRPSCN